MTREELLSTFRSNLGETQISERSIAETIDKLGLADNEAIGEDFVNKLSDVFKTTLQGNISAVVTGAVNEKNARITALQNEIEALKKGGNSQVTPTNDTPNEDFVKLQKEFEDFKAAQSAKEDAQKVSSIRSQIKSALKSQLEGARVSVNDYILTQSIKELDVTTETKVSEAVKVLETAYTENLKAAGLGGQYQPKGGGNQGGDGQPTVVKNFFAKKKEKEGWGTK